MGIYTLLLVILVFEVVTSESKFSNDTLTESINAFLHLLNLTDATCDDFEWCTIRKENTAVYWKTTHLYFRGCCASCSCEPSCFAKLNCCPDYKLKKYLNGSINTNIPQLVSAMEEIQNVEDIDLRLTAHNTTLSTNEELPTECISSDMNNLTSKISHKGSFYRMVSKCINRSVSLEIKRKCELSETRISDASLDDIRPVQSMESGMLYRNEYCLFCSPESNANYEKWDVYVSDEDLPYGAITRSPTSYEAVVEYLLKRSSSRINILFEPSDIIRSKHPPRNCLNTDVDTCSSEGGNNDQLACRWFPLPLYIWNRSRKRYINYNNVACVHCNNIKLTGQRSACSSYQHEPKYLFLGQLSNEMLDHEGLDLSQTEQAGILNKDLSPSQCGKGFVFDNAQRVCRQLYCPCGLVAYKFGCRPVFKTMGGKDIEFFVSITKPDIPARHPAEDNYVDALVDYFDDEFKSDDNVYIDAMLVGKSSDSLQIPEHVVYILVRRHTFGFDYLSFVRKIDTAARGIRTIKVGMQEISVRMSIVDSMHLLQGKMINRAFATSYDLVYSRMHDSSKGNGPVLTLLSCFFCYRVELFEDDFIVKGDVLFLRNVRKRMSSFSLTTIDKDKHLICSNEVLGYLPNSDKSGTDYNPLGDEDRSADDFQANFTEKYAVVIVAFVITMILAIKHFCKRAFKISAPLASSLERDVSS